MLDDNGKRICGAKTRKGTPCQRSPMSNGRCYLHGGASLSGIASPRFKHGRYSKYLPPHLKARYQEALDDGELLALRDEIAVVNARISEIMDQLSRSEGGQLWLALQQNWAEFSTARSAGDNTGAASALIEIGQAIQRGATQQAIWAELLGVFEQRRRLVESERKRLVEMQQTITVERAMLLVGALQQIVRSHVSDRDTLAGIANDIRRLVNADTLPSG